MTDFTPEQKAWMEKNERCPFCGSNKVSEGPSGGLSQNLYCGGEHSDPLTGDAYECGARFNSTPFGFELIRRSGIPESEWACRQKKKRFRSTFSDTMPPKPPKSKYTADEIVAKFTGKQRHWWQRKVRP